MVVVVVVVDVTVLVLVKADELCGVEVEVEVTSEAVDGTASGIGEEVRADEAVVEVTDGGTCNEHRKEIS